MVRLCSTAKCTFVQHRRGTIKNANVTGTNLEFDPIDDADMKNCLDKQLCDCESYPAWGVYLKWHSCLNDADCCLSVIQFIQFSLSWKKAASSILPPFHKEMITPKATNICSRNYLNNITLKFCIEIPDIFFISQTTLKWMSYLQDENLGSKTDWNVSITFHDKEKKKFRDYSVFTNIETYLKFLPDSSLFNICKSCFSMLTKSFP